MEPVIFKISGSLTDSPVQMEAITSMIVEKREHGGFPMIVHGGGKQINELSKKLGVEVIQHEGRRVTDHPTLEILSYTIGGSINRGIVAKLRSVNIPAVGLTGVDGFMTTASRRPPIEIQKHLIDFGLVGEISEIDPTLIEILLKNAFVPVIGCLTWSKNEGILNINADTFSNKLAHAVGATEMIMFMDVDAVLDSDKHPISELTYDEFLRGKKEGWIRDGMIPKLDTGFDSLKNGVPIVRIGSPQGFLSGISTQLIGEA
ncbi:MAG TPA: acetylglutamate kinase [Bacteroidetes bacterium]|nr:acetylglutamate kinase [Bacteroidota bacterium]